MSDHSPDRGAGRMHDVLGIGFGPSNLALAIAIESAIEPGGERRDALR